MSKKQTAVEWFAQQVLSYKSSTNINGTDYILIPINKVEFLKTKAKQMEKDQIIEAFWSGDNSDCTAEQNSKEFAEQYYNDNYDQSN